MDIPKDILTAPCEFHYPERVSRPGYRPVVRSAPYQVQRAAQVIADAKRPVVLAGHGVHVARAWEELQRFAERVNAPVVSTLLGLTALSADHPLCLGMAGMHGVAWANLAIQNADLLIAMGMRMDDRFTGSLRHFAPQAKLLHVDIDPAEIGKRVPAAVPMVGDVRFVMEALTAAAAGARSSGMAGPDRCLARAPSPGGPRPGAPPAPGGHPRPPSGHGR